MGCLANDALGSLSKVSQDPIWHQWLTFAEQHECIVGDAHEVGEDVPFPLRILGLQLWFILAGCFHLGWLYIGLQTRPDRKC